MGETAQRAADLSLLARKKSSEIGILYYILQDFSSLRTMRTFILLVVTLAAVPLTFSFAPSTTRDGVRRQHVLVYAKDEKQDINIPNPLAEIGGQLYVLFVSYCRFSTTHHKSTHKFYHYICVSRDVLQL